MSAMEFVALAAHAGHLVIIWAAVGLCVTLWFMPTGASPARTARIGSIEPVAERTQDFEFGLLTNAAGTGLYQPFLALAHHGGAFLWRCGSEAASADASPSAFSATNRRTFAW